LAQNNIRLVWQTGKQYYPQAQELQKKYTNIKVYDFISKMDYAYAVADTVVSRAGAISLSELCITGLPCILVPSPNVSEDHQTKNAMELVNHKAALMIKDIDAMKQLGSAIIKLAKDSEVRASLGENISALAIKDSAARIASEVIALTEQK
jgi:UDP-N-acetylglucosamine--N-acetylmuramyl-(pentapeptide) pyrophosphoryl-undecaprenol N-acetylglucosamine transferase